MSAVLWSPTVTGRGLCLECQFSRLPQAKGDPQVGRARVTVRCSSRCSNCPGHEGYVAGANFKFLRLFLRCWFVFFSLL